MEKLNTDILVIGAGPGGYAAAFYAADMGKKVILVEQDQNLGGVCLNRGCIPSKALLRATHLIRETDHSSTMGITFVKPKVDINTMRAWKNAVITKLAGGISQLAAKRKVEVIRGRAHFEDSKTVRIEVAGEGQKFINFQKTIIATGSKPALPREFDLGNPRVMTSTEALDLEDVPEDLLIIGGGYIGIELGTVYATLGSKVTVVEALDEILRGADQDLLRPVKKYIESAFKEVRTSTKVQKIATSGKKIQVTTETNGEKREELYDRVLVSIGRVPNCDDLGLKNTKVTRDSKGFIEVNDQMQTADSGIYAIGDVVGGMMLAHKASKEARIAVEVIIGEHSTFKNVFIPAVVFTDPEIAWVGLTEDEARAKNIPVQVAKFPWGALGRAVSYERVDGMTKIIVEPETERVLGVGIVGVGAGDLIGEAVLALEMGASVRDIAEAVHPHPTFSESMMESAELFYGHSTHVILTKREPAPATETETDAEPVAS